MIGSFWYIVIILTTWQHLWMSYTLYAQYSNTYKHSCCMIMMIMMIIFFYRKKNWSQKKSTLKTFGRKKLFFLIFFWWFFFWKFFWRVKVLEVFIKKPKFFPIIEFWWVVFCFILPFFFKNNFTVFYSFFFNDEKLKWRLYDDFMALYYFLLKNKICVYVCSRLFGWSNCFKWCVISSVYFYLYFWF
jgi:hypothetical protein